MIKKSSFFYVSVLALAKRVTKFAYQKSVFFKSKKNKFVDASRSYTGHQIPFFAEISQTAIIYVCLTCFIEFNVLSTFYCVRTCMFYIIVWFSIPRFIMFY